MANHKGTPLTSDLISEDEVRDVLRDTFFVPPTQETRPAKPKNTKPKPDHYEVICISLYKEDLQKLDEKVASLKASGHRRVSRSGLIRFALDQVDVSKLPRTY